MSRSFGDEIASSIGIIAEPEVQFFEVTDDLAFILIASDGVWEFMSDQDVVDSIALKRAVHGLSFHEAIDAVVVESESCTLARPAAQPPLRSAPSSIRSSRFGPPLTHAARFCPPHSLRAQVTPNGWTARVWLTTLQSSRSHF